MILMQEETGQTRMAEMVMILMTDTHPHQTRTTGDHHTLIHMTEIHMTGIHVIWFISFCYEAMDF